MDTTEEPVRHFDWARLIRRLHKDNAPAVIARHIRENQSNDRAAIHWVLIQEAYERKSAASEAVPQLPLERVDRAA